MYYSKIILKCLIFPIYYLIHKNFIFGLLQKKIIKKFYFRNFKFDLDSIKLPISNYSSFLWNTYELNDRIIIQRNIDKKNKCIIIGGGIGFIATLVYSLTKQTVLIFEINFSIISLLAKNLRNNKVKFKLFNKNLLVCNKKLKKYYYDSRNFLSNSIYRKTSKIMPIKNINFKKIKNFKSFNTLIIDAEGVEEIYIKNILVIPNIIHLIFEFHDDIFDEHKKKVLFKYLNTKSFHLADNFLNTYYFKKF